MKRRCLLFVFCVLLAVSMMQGSVFAASADAAQSLAQNPNVAAADFYPADGSVANPCQNNSVLLQIYQAEDGKYGLKTEDGIVLLDPVWDDIRNFYPEENAPYAVERDGKWGLVKADGTVLAEPQYKEIVEVVSSGYTDALLRVLDFNDQYGLFDYSGNLVLPIQYDFVDEEIFEGTIQVGRDYGYTLVDLQGSELLPLQKGWVHKTDSPDYFICAPFEGGCSLVRSSGETVLATAYENMALAGENALIVKAGDLTHLINFSGEILATVQNGTMQATEDGGVVMAVDPQQGLSYYDLSGRLIGGRSWEAEISFYGDAQIAGLNLPREERLYLVKENGLYGYINFSGDLVVPPTYEDAYGLFVQKDGLTGLLNTDGSYRVEPRWTVPPNNFSLCNGCYTFYLPEESVGSVNGTGGSGVMSLRGEILLEPVYDMVYLGVNDWLLVWDAASQGVYHITLTEQATPLDDAALCKTDDQLEVVRQMAAQGVITADEGGDLRLDAEVSRAEFLTMLSRVDGWDAADESAGFPDTAGHWAEGVIAAAVQKGLVSGYADGSFGPEDPVTVRQALTILYRALGCPEEELQKGLYDDAVFGDIQFYARLTFGRGYSNNELVTRKDAAFLFASYQKLDADLSDYQYRVGEAQSEEPPTFWL